MAEEEKKHVKPEIAIGGTEMDRCYSAARAHVKKLQSFVGEPGVDVIGASAYHTALLILEQRRLEREACAEIAADYAGGMSTRDVFNTCEAITNAIRARGEPGR